MNTLTVPPPRMYGGATLREYRNAELEIQRAARLSVDAPRIPWDVFVRTQLDWRQGEHFALIGPTGQGKTVMLQNLLTLHPYVVVLATKPRDESMDSLIAHGYARIERWRSLDPRYYPKRVLWPDASRMDSLQQQREVFHDAFARIYLEGGWTVAVDELWFINNKLKLGEDVKTYLLQARSLDISLLAATQRPAWVPTELFDQSTHLMFWRDNDETNLKRIAGISYLSADMIKRTVASLEQYQVLYINTRTGRMCRTRCPEFALTA